MVHRESCRPIYFGDSSSRSKVNDANADRWFFRAWSFSQSASAGVHYGARESADFFWFFLWLAVRMC